MKNNMYHMSIEHDFDAYCDEEAVKMYCSMLHMAGIRTDSAKLRSKNGTILAGRQPDVDLVTDPVASKISEFMVNQLGINLVSVDSIKVDRLSDGQITDIHISLIPSRE